MNVSEAHDVNTVLRFLLGQPALGRRTKPNAVEALGAAKRLADRANRTLMCGIRGDDVERNFTRTRPMREARDRVRAQKMARKGAKA